MECCLSYNEPGGTVWIIGYIIGKLAHISKNSLFLIMFPIEPVLPENNPYKMMVYQHVPYYLVILVDDPFSDTPKSSQIHHYLVNVESSCFVAKSPFFTMVYIYTYIHIYIYISHHFFVVKSILSVFPLSIFLGGAFSEPIDMSKKTLLVTWAMGISGSTKFQSTTRLIHSIAMSP